MNPVPPNDIPVTRDKLGRMLPGSKLGRMNKGKRKPLTTYSQVTKYVKLEIAKQLEKIEELILQKHGISPLIENSRNTKLEKWRKRRIKNEEEFKNPTKFTPTAMEPSWIKRQNPVIKRTGLLIERAKPVHTGETKNPEGY